MLLWIVRDTVPWAWGDDVERNYQVPASTPGQALASTRQLAEGKLAVVGYILNGRDHAFRPSEFIHP